MEALRATRVLHAADQEPFPAPSRIRIITIANQKGGVGKTTSTVNLGVALALYGLRTLVIDLDPQGNTSTALGVDHTVGTPSIYDALVGDSTLSEVVHPTTASPNLRCVPATIDLAGAEIELVSVVAREHRLRRAIEALHRGPPRGAAAALRPHRLPAVPGPADPQRAGGRRRGAHPHPVRVLRAGGAGAAALEHRPRPRAPQSRRSPSARSCSRCTTAGRSWPTRSPTRCATTSGTLVLHARSSPATSGSPRRPGYGQSVLTYDPGSRGSTSYVEAARELAQRGAVLPPLERAATPRRAAARSPGRRPDPRRAGGPDRRPVQDAGEPVSTTHREEQS